MRRIVMAESITEVEPPTFERGWYTPNGRQAIRTSPSTKFPSIRVGYTEAGKGFEVDTMRVDANSDTWLKIAKTGRWVAFIYGKDILGEGEWRYE